MVRNKWPAVAGVLLLGLLGPERAVAATFDWVTNIYNDGADTLPAGGRAGYLVTVFNDSLDVAPATTITLPVPPGTVWLDATGSITGCAEASGVVSCTVPELGADESATLNIGFVPSDEGTISVTATIPAADHIPANNSATVSTTIIRGADISLVPSGMATVPSGGTASYSFTATNLGPYASQGFTVSFPVPTGLEAIVPPAGCSLSGGNHVCTVAGPIAVGGSVDFPFSGIAVTGAASTITLSGSVSGGTPPDPISANDLGSFNIAVTPGSDVRLAKTRAPAGALTVGDTVSFTLTPSYNGDVPFGLTLTDTLPGNYSILSVTPASGTWSCATTGQTVDCTLASGGVAGFNQPLGQVVIEAEVMSDGPATNTATIAASGPFDPDTSNNTASDGGITIAPPRIDLAIRKTAPEPPLVVVGGSYTWRLSAANTGNAGYFGTVRIEDFVPEGLTVTALGGSGWVCAPALPLAGPATVTCDRDYSPADRLRANTVTPDIVMTTTVTQSGRIDNGARVSAINGNLPDDNPANDTITVGVDGSIPANAADIRVLKTAQNPTVIAGEQQVYQLQVVNEGPAASLDVTLTDLLADLVNSDTTGPDRGYVSIGTVPGVAEGLVCSTAPSGPRSVTQTCAITRLPVCAVDADCPRITITVRPGGDGGARTNTATVTSTSTADPDLANNSASAAFTVEPRADVTITKTATPSPVPAGQELIYVLTASNLDNGLSQAENVTITDTLPPGLTFLSADPSTGSCAATPAAGTVTGASSNNLIQCNLGTLNNGAQQTVTVTVRPNQVYFGGTVTNAASVTTTTVETDGSNNSVSITTPVQQPVFDLLIGKTEDIDPVAVGQDVVYTLRASNRGPSTAENVVVTDTLPDALLSFEGLSVPADVACGPLPAPGTVGGTVGCTIPFLAAQDRRDILLTMRGVAKGVAVNRASISADGSVQFDTNAGNDNAIQNTTVRSRADMAVTKTASAPTANLGEGVNFTIRVSNLAGPLLAEADQVVLTDTLPAGMVLTGQPTATLVAGSTGPRSCTGASGASAFSCSFGTMTSGAVVDVAVPVRIASLTANPQTLTNTASVATASLDVNPANNESDAAVQVSASSLSGRVFNDFNDNGSFDANDTGLFGVPMTLNGTDLNGTLVTRTTSTTANGTFSFGLLPEGTYEITQGTPPQGFLAGRSARVGTSGGTSGGDTQIIAIPLGGAVEATDYLFPKVPQARIGLAKAVSQPPVVAPDGSFTVGFSLLVRNLSSEPLQAITVTDPLAGVPPLFGSHSASGPLPSGGYRVTGTGGSCAGRNAGFDGSGDATLVAGLTLAAGASCTVTMALQVQPAVPLPFVSGPRYLNQASVEATGAWTGQTSATNPQLTDLSTNGANPDPDGDGQANEAAENQPTPVSPTLTPGIALVKTADASGLGEPEVNDVISYAFAITNTGNVTLTDVTLADPLPGIALSGTPIPVLLPGETNSTAFTATYALTAADLAAGRVENQATASGLWGFDALGGPLRVADLSGTEATNDADTVVNLGSIALVKTVDVSALSSPPAVDDVLTFGFAITNTGQATLGNVTLVDPLPGLVLSGGPIPALAAGATSTVHTATYRLTAADLDAGRLTNSATVTATTPDGAGGVRLVMASDTTETPLAPAPAIALVKTADTSGLGASPMAGEVIRYAFAVTNTGNVTLTDVTVADLLPGLTLTGGPIASLAAGQTDASISATYALTQADIEAGRIENTATVTASHAGPGTVSDVSGTDSANDTPTVVTLAQRAAIALVKSADASALGTPPEPGEVIRFAFTITNTGNVTLRDITLDDDLAGVVLSGGPIATLEPGASDATTFSATYALTVADLDAGQVANQARVTGTALTGPVSDLSGTSATTDDATIVPLTLRADVRATKTASADRVRIGDTLRYTLAFTSASSGRVRDVTVIDVLPPGLVYTPGSARVGGVPQEPQVAGRTLRWPGQSIERNGTLTVTLDVRVAASSPYGALENRAWLTGPGEDRLSNIATATVQREPEAVFDCTDIIGKVFDDRNADGFQQPNGAEPGLAGVRLATTAGLLVTTDAFGRFHVPCPDLPKAVGSNFTMKLDTRSLPTGFRLTTENPRTIRVTPGKMAKLDFGAALSRVVRIDVSAAAFAPDGQPGAALREGVAGLAAQMKADPVVLRLTYRLADEGEGVARDRLARVEALLRDAWGGMAPACGWNGPFSRRDSHERSCLDAPWSPCRVLRGSDPVADGGRRAGVRGGCLPRRDRARCQYRKVAHRADPGRWLCDQRGRRSAGRVAGRARSATAGGCGAGGKRHRAAL
jgi:uncharacterized repeat protein (TIGR01451 family)